MFVGGCSDTTGLGREPGVSHSEHSAQPIPPSRPHVDTFHIPAPPNSARHLIGPHIHVGGLTVSVPSVPALNLTPLPTRAPRYSRGRFPSVV